MCSAPIHAASLNPPISMRCCACSLTECAIAGAANTVLAKPNAMLATDANQRLPATPHSSLIRVDRAEARSGRMMIPEYFTLVADRGLVSTGRGCGLAPASLGRPSGRRAQLDRRVAMNEIEGGIDQGQVRDPLWKVA